MTIIDAFNAVLIELNKVQAPPILLSDFVYFYNKSVQLFINKRYTLFEHNLQLTDDLRVLTKTVALNVLPNTGNAEAYNNDAFGDGYVCQLPDDYMHILNCVCEFKNSSPKCDNNELTHIGASKLDTQKWASVITNYYMKPSWKKPYYYISNLLDPVENPTYKKDQDKQSGIRYGNSSIPVMQIKCGKEDKKHMLNKVYVEYLRTPKYINLTHKELDKVEDTTEPLEFPDYVVYEIINNIVMLVMENNGNPRVQSNPVVNTTILDMAQSAK